MKNKILKNVFVVSSLLIAAALLISGCNGAISFQGSASPNEEGGLDISGGTTQQETADSSGGTGMNQTTMILIAVGVGLFILILVMVTRNQSRGEPRS